MHKNFFGGAHVHKPINISLPATYFLSNGPDVFFGHGPTKWCTCTNQWMSSSVMARKSGAQINEFMFCLSLFSWVCCLSNTGVSPWEGAPAKMSCSSRFRRWRYECVQSSNSNQQCCIFDAMGSVLDKNIWKRSQTLANLDEDERQEGSESQNVGFTDVTEKQSERDADERILNANDTQYWFDDARADANLTVKDDNVRGRMREINAAEYISTPKLSSNPRQGAASWGVSVSQLGGGQLPRGCSVSRDCHVMDGRRLTKRACYPMCYIQTQCRQSFPTHTEKQILLCGFSLFWYHKIVSCHVDTKHLCK